MVAEQRSGPSSLFCFKAAKVCGFKRSKFAEDVNFRSTYFVDVNLHADVNLRKSKVDMIFGHFDYHFGDFRAEGLRREGILGNGGHRGCEVRVEPIKSSYLLPGFGFRFSVFGLKVEG